MDAIKVSINDLPRLSRPSPIPHTPARPRPDPTRHTPLEEAQGNVFGVTMAALGMHVLTHTGIVTGLPFPAVYVTITLPFGG